MCAQSDKGRSLVYHQCPFALVGRADKGGRLSSHNVSPVARGTCARVRALEEGRKEPFSHVIAGQPRWSWGSSPLTSHPVVLYSALRALVPSFSGSLSRSVVVTHCSEVISKTISPLFRVSSQPSTRDSRHGLHLELSNSLKYLKDSIAKCSLLTLDVKTAHIPATAIFSHCPYV